MLSIKKISIIIFTGFIIFNGSNVSAIETAAISDNKISESEQLKIKLAHYLEKENNDARVTYNLGVIYYKLKQYDQAKVYFHKLLSIDAYHLVAKYNLGLVAYKSGNTKEAIQWFKRISAHKHKFKSSEKIINLAKVQLDKLNKHKTTARKKVTKPVRLKNYVLAYYGHADNLIDPNGTVTIGDSFLNIYGSLTLNLDDIVMQVVSCKFSLYSRGYTSLHDYDYKIVSTDFGKLFKRNNWRHSMRLRLGRSTYGATDYQSVVRAELKTQYKKSLYKVAARYRYYDITSEDVLYDAYEGSRQILYFNYDRSVKAHKFRVGLSFETNDRADVKSATGTDLSYSPTREKIELVWFYKFNKKWKSRLKYEYRDSLYNDFNEADNIVREETLASSSVQLKYRLQKNWWLVSDFRYSDNDSNIARYSYTRNVTRIGISGSF